MISYIKIMRPGHWMKNIFVFAALVFGQKFPGLSGEPLKESFLTFMAAFGAFVCFCFASSAIYILNDIIDCENDRLHPEKKHRPIAAGNIPVNFAVLQAILCAAVAIYCGYLLVFQLAVIIAVYIIMMVAYSLLLKRMMILDVITISIGFVLRAVAGAIVVGVFISPWLIICTFAICLFLGFGKRRSEVAMLAENSEAFRKTLSGYTPELLGHMLDVSSALAITCFLLYATDDRTVQTFGTNNLVFTTPLVLYCVFRFSALIQKGKFTGPVALILHDLPFKIGFLLWGISCVLIIYASKLGFTFSDILAY